jgi:NAD+ synthase (glutamine-hydrolysing)
MKDGKKTFQAPRLQDGIFLAEDGELIEFPNSLEKLAENLVYGLREYMESIGQKRLVLGLSGGIDSALVAMLAVEALGQENVIAVNMPSEYNSDTTKNLAKELAAELGIDYKIVPIGESVEATKAQIESVFGIKVE